ncbi:hypothetical protein AB1K62_14065 [Parasphingorhabdus sp. JC815]|uniref:hypothetical protein n=1 Tax=Parasphingorhabdus sp. JC815 TaxID=3232140 RepID=UPI003459E103
MSGRPGQTWYEVNADNVANSNRFLRAFWAALRHYLGPYAWLFQPYKNGENKIVRFGRVSFSESTVVEFGISYDRRGVIDQLWCRPETDDESLREGVSESVENARRILHHPRSEWYTVEISVFPHVEMANYTADYIKLTGLTSGAVALSLNIPGYDRIDRQTQFYNTAAPILDALSVFTNCSYQYCTTSGHEEFSEEPNVRWCPPDWLDDFPLMRGRLSISSSQLRYLDQLTIESSDSSAVHAARLFHQAIKLDNEGSLTMKDAARMLYLSALEAASAPEQNPNKCVECGQSIYSIRKRVRDVTSRYLGEAAEKIIDQAYRARSGYLHTGNVLGKTDLRAGAGPQLDPSAQSGCIRPAGLDNTINVREFISYILRKIAIDQRSGTASHQS